MSVWDNQQAMMSWFVGILEGEGCAFRGKNRSVIQITNTDIEIIDKCVSFLNSKTIFNSITATAKKNPKHKKVYNIRVLQTNNCYTLIKTLGDSFQCRYEEFLTKLELRASTTTRDITLTSDFHWLVGLFEAEGSIGLEYDNKGYYNPALSVKSIRENIIEKFAITLKSLGCSWYTESHTSENPNHSKIYVLRMRGLKRCARFLYIVKDLFQSQYYFRRANLLHEFCSGRLLKSCSEPYTQRDSEIYHQLRLKI